MIGIELRNALDDLSYWQEHSTYSLIECAIRLHHRLVWIHPFPNGNGRWSRMAADVFLRSNNLPPLTWGSISRVDTDTLRRSYISALRKADNYDFDDLLDFCTS